jgi:putative ABC transport system ATP-binding protein
VIKVRNLKKVYKVGELDLTVINDFSIDINDGEFISFIGPSGSGKSTVLNMIGCLDTPTAGTLIINNQDISKLDKTQYRISSYYDSKFKARRKRKKNSKTS